MQLVDTLHRHRHRHGNHLTKVLKAAISRMIIDLIDVAEALQKTAINMNERLVIIFWHMFFLFFICDINVILFCQKRKDREDDRDDNKRYRRRSKDRESGSHEKDSGKSRQRERDRERDRSSERRKDRHDERKRYNRYETAV